MTVVEMIGLPGAGKTTLIGRLIGLTESDECKYSLSRKKINYREKFLFLFFLYKFNFFGVNILNRETYKRIKYIYILRLSLENEQCRMLVLDQGLIQAVWSLVMRLPKTPEKLTQLIQVCCGDSIPHKVVWLKVSPDQALFQFKKRTVEGGNKTGFDHLTDDQLVVTFDKGEVLFEKIALSLSKLGVERLNINGDYNDLHSILKI